MVASGSTEEHDSEDNTNHCGDESTQDEPRENAANSDLEVSLWVLSQLIRLEESLSLV